MARFSLQVAVRLAAYQSRERGHGYCRCGCCWQLAKAERGHLLAEQVMDIAPVLRIVVNELVQGSHGADRIDLSVPAGPVLSDIDPDAFAILARNLIENALKHGTPEEPIQVTLTQDGMLSVNNDGPIVPPDLLARLSCPFARGQGGAGGVGLGLAIAKAISSGAGRELTLTSPPNGKASGFEARFSAGKQAA